MLYQAFQTQSDLMSPLRLLAQSGAAAFWLVQTEGSMLRKLAATLDVLSRLRSPTRGQLTALTVCRSANGGSP